MNIIMVLYKYELSDLQHLFLSVYRILCIALSFYRLFMCSVIITIAYLLFSLITVEVLLFCYVVLFLHNYCTFPYGIKTIKRIHCALYEAIGK